MATQNSINEQGPIPICQTIITAASTTISNNTSTLITFDNAQIDTINAMNTSTYRYLPITNNGYYYLVNLTVVWTDVVGTYLVQSSIRTNGAAIRANGYRDYVSTGVTNSMSINTVVLLNGTTDYIDFLFLQQSGGNMTLQGSTTTKTVAIITQIPKPVY